MLKNYLKIAWRNLLQNKSHSLINIIGLSVGMACCILIALYINKEMSYDRFHEKSDRIVVVGKNHNFLGRGLTVPYPLADVIQGEIPSVKQTTRIRRISEILLSRNGEDFVEIDNGSYAEPSFFDFFSFKLIKGYEDDALNSPGQILLTPEVARKFFGDENPVGKSIYWNQRDTVRVMQVSGLIEPPPETSTFSYNALISYKTMDKDLREPDTWGGYMHLTFAMLDRPASFPRVNRQLNSISNKSFNEEKTTFFGIPLESLHLSDLTQNEGFIGNINYLYLFGSIAVFILFIACVNYVNLSTARVSQRAHEVGIRKSLGATRNQLAFQFLSESVLLSLGAFLMGIVLTEMALPFFNQLFGTSLTLAGNAGFLGWLGLGAVGVGLLAGAYPAFYLVRFSPASILRNVVPTGNARSLLRKSLVVSQFCIALVLIIGSLAVYKQLQYAQTKDLGFNDDRLVSIQMENPRLWNMRQKIKKDIRNFADLEKVSVTKAVPGGRFYWVGLRPGKFSSREQAETDDRISVTPLVVDRDFLEVMDIELLAGRNFSKKDRSASKKAYILNREAARQLGWSAEEAVDMPFDLDRKGSVIGITENFHIASVREEIEPVVLQIEARPRGTPTYVLARLKSDRVAADLKNLQDGLTEYAPRESMTYEFMDEKFDAMYRTEQRFGKITLSFTFIAIFVACLGLFGLASFSAERRIKEIGIRKAVGATMTQILWLLNKDFIKLVLTGFIIAAPIAWYLVRQWLQSFAYKTQMGMGIFVLAGSAAIVIALLTVSGQSYRAARLNPADSIRNE